MIAARSTIAQYRVDELIAIGGMGEIYKATDERLGRLVALKVLPPELDRSPERIRRFLLEAKAASQLNHPNILTVHDAGEAEAQTEEGARRIHFIATELVVGTTLRDVIHRDRLPLRKLIPLLAQAASGVAKAHEAGIVHRDLKPDNIMVTADGFAKVLDFGLAKLVEAERDRSTVTDHTREGVVLGTVAYMSPEQARGLPVDHRSDIFAFGAVLYEAAARRRPFGGTSAPDLLHRIAHEDPEPLAGVPHDLERLIRRMLAKDPDERVQSMKDVALELHDIDRSWEELRLTPALRRRRLSASMRRAAAVVVLAAAAFAVGFLLRRDATPASLVRFTVEAPPGNAFTTLPNSATASQFALSPDGTRLAFVAARGSAKPQIWVRSLSSIDARPLPGSDGALFPFWSPRSDAIAFFADGKLKRVGLNGDPPVILADAESPRGGTWGSSDVVLFAPGAKGVMRVPADGGEVTAALPLQTAAQEVAQRWPAFLPDGRRFLYLSWRRGAPPALRAGELGSPTTRAVTEADSQAVVAPDGDILFVRKGSLYVLRLDGDLRPSGQAVLVQRDIGFAPFVTYAAVSVSQTNVLAYAPWVNPGRTISAISPDGRSVRAISEPADWTTTSISVRGARALVPRTDAETGNFDIWSLDLDRGISSRATSDTSNENHPVWSPDGRSFAFTSTRNGTQQAFVKDLATQRERLLDTGALSPRPASWSAGGDSLLVSIRPPAKDDLWLLSMSGGFRPWLATPSAEWGAAVSPDGRRVAYISDESGRDEIYVQPFPAGGDPYRVSTSGGMTPRWSADGNTLFFVTLDGDVSAVSVKQRDKRFETALPRVVFRIPGRLELFPTFQHDFDVTADGRFITVVTPDTSRPPPIVIAVNWQRPR